MIWNICHFWLKYKGTEPGHRSTEPGPFFKSPAQRQDNFVLRTCTTFAIKYCCNMFFMVLMTYQRKIKQQNGCFIAILIQCKQTHQHRIRTHQHPSGPNHQHRTFSRRTTIPTVVLEKFVSVKIPRYNSEKCRLTRVLSSSSTPIV